MKRTLYTCRCESLEHILIISADEEDFFFGVHLAPLPFWGRVRNAVRYVFGKRCKYGDFEEIMLSPASAVALGDTLIEWAQGEVTAFPQNDVH
jgi:hypothetical protein